ncbi:glycoside hydrolase family 35 protein [Propioniciclava soli]|uniref:Beta-galactosidase n=1 Tax=Propioniciclava soli TaxID=2775081 RepID=A0ABZ3C5V5_9ACTN|nr:beta-galactosidase family protein [Propioniciclava soli]
MTLDIVDGGFVRDGRPHQIISGAVHYFRVHPELWRDRLERVAALGLNTVETYLAWNYHERTPGTIDFSGPRDVRRFIELAGELGLDVLVRPGPYICAEWDFGGLPAWLMRTPMALRTADPAFLATVDRWLDAAVAEIAPLLATRGGPVVGVQVENEYGSYGSDAAYLAHVRDGLVRRGVDVWLFTSDGPGPDWLAHGAVPGVTATVNFGSRVAASFAELRRVRPDDPPVCMEFWNGWFDHWGEPHHTREAQDAAATLAEMLTAGAGVNFYMAHGGTNHGLWSGANHDGERLQPTVTSYDYDAPVGEAGELTAKFHAYADVIAAHTGRTPPPAPAPLPRHRPQQVAVTGWASLLDHADLFGPPRHAAHPLPLEELGADHGLALYEGSTFVPPEGRDLVLEGLADRAELLVDGVSAGTADRNDGEARFPLTPRADGAERQLTLVVENAGRINFGPRLGERKGLTGVRLGDRFVHGWASRALTIDDPAWLGGVRWSASRPATAGPLLARAEMVVDAPADGFLALPSWGRGFCWLNGVLLGRFDEVGPQRTLYAALPLWRAGANEIVVGALAGAGVPTDAGVQLRDEPELDGSVHIVNKS